MIDEYGTLQESKGVFTLSFERFFLVICKKFIRLLLILIILSNGTLCYRRDGAKNWW